MFNFGIQQDCGLGQYNPKTQLNLSDKYLVTKFLKFRYKCPLKKKQKGQKI